MKRPFTRLEKKQLLIFALIAFGIPYLLGNGLVQSVSQTIDIYVLNWGISQGDFSIGTAAGIFKSVVSIVLIVIANQIAKRNGDERLF